MTGYGLAFPKVNTLRWEDNFKVWTGLTRPETHVTKDREAWQKLVRKINGAPTTILVKKKKKRRSKI